MTTDHTLDQLLAQSGDVTPVNPATMLAARARLDDQIDARALRAARVVRLRRRHRRLTIGVAAASVAGVLALSIARTGSHEGSRTPYAGSSTVPSSPSTSQGSPSAPVEVDFTTVAQVVKAASASTTLGGVDPTAAPYWKVTTQWDCSGVPDAAGAERPAGSTCENTMWTGNGRPGVSQDADGQTREIPEATVSIEGSEMTWAAANGRRLSAAQVASMVADNADGSKTDRAPSGYYVFKNASELLANSPASPSIRQRLWRQLAQVEGVTFDGRDTDALGRSGWRLTWGSPIWGEISILIDTSTGMPLETSDRAPKRTAWNTSTIVSAEPAETAPATLSNADLPLPYAG